MKRIWMALFLFSPATFANIGGNVSGGGDSAVTEFLLIAHRIGQYAVKHKDTSPVDGERFLTAVRALESTLHPLYPGAARIQFSPDDVKDDYGVSKEGRFDQAVIRITRPRWRDLFDSDKYVLVGTEVLGVNGQNRYVVSQWILQNEAEIARERVDFTPILLQLLTEKTNMPGPVHEFGSTKVGNTVSWLKNVFSEGLHKGHTADGRECNLFAFYFPVEHGLKANGVELALSADHASARAGIIDEESRLPKKLDVSLSRDAAIVDGDYGRGWKWVSGTVIGGPCWIDRGRQHLAVRVDPSRNLVSVAVKSSSYNCAGSYKEELTCVFREN